MRLRFYPWVRKIPWRRKWQPTRVFLSGESRRQRRLVGYSPWGRKESDTNTLHFLLKKTWKPSITIGNLRNDACGMYKYMYLAHLVKSLYRLILPMCSALSSGSNCLQLVILLEKAMAPHSSTLAWKIPWTEEPGGLVVHGVARSRTWLSDFTFTFFRREMLKIFKDRCR